MCPGFVHPNMSAWLRASVPPVAMMSVDDVVTAVFALLDLSPRTVVNELVISRAGTSGYSA